MVQLTTQYIILVLLDCISIKSIFGFILQSLVVTCTIIGAYRSTKEQDGANVEI